MSFIIKLKKANVPTRLAHFDVQPSWGDLASKINGLYNVSPKNVSVTFFDDAKDGVTITSEKELQYYYEQYYQPSKEIKFVVQDLQFPDIAELTSTWSADSNLSGLSGDDDQLTLFCWVLNVSNNPFPVDIGKSMTAGHLKETIKKKKEHTFDGIEADTLELWKLSPSIPSAEIYTKLKGIQSPQQIQDSNKLNPLDELLQHFPSPTRKHLHIIVEAPPTLKERRITPPEITFDFETIDKQIQAELKLLRPAVEAFLKAPELPTWDPPDNLTSDIKEFIKGLQIPTYRNGRPSLLFHKLDECDDKEITKIFGADTHMCICNTSGSGKTRRILEGLTKYWGFYLVAVPDVNGVGIRDLQDALDLIATYRDWVPDLHALSPEQWATQNNINSQITSRVFHRVLAARIVVFKFFLQVAIEVDGGLKEKHKRIWLLFQLFDILSPHGGTFHPFLRIIDKIRGASDEALNTLILGFHSIIHEFIPGSRSILGLDEAQRATRLYPYSGISLTKPKVFRSIIHDMVKVFTKVSIKLVVSGTGLLLADLEESMASGVSKPAHGVKVFHELGMFDTWPKLKSFVERYIPLSILQSHSGYGLQVRMQEYLLVGEYRFSVSFLEYFLMNGLQSPHKLLNKNLEGHITCPPGDTGHPFTSGEPDLISVVDVGSFDWDRLQLDSSAIQEAIAIVQSHLIKGEPPTYGPVTAKLVEYGIARLREKHEGHIIEPLAFLSVMTWLKTHCNQQLEAGIRLRAGDGHSRGYAFEETMVLYLLRKLRYPVPLSTIFDFHPKLTPPWASEEAHIVARLNGAYVPVDIIGTAPQNPSLGVVHYAETIEDVVRWIETLDPAPAILIPSNSFGPDILLRVKFMSRIVILMGQFKSYTTGNRYTLAVGTLSNALDSLHPGHWFKNLEKDQRQKLINTIKKHCVLPLVAGYPLLPNLTSKAETVTQAMFDSSDALASVNLDQLRQHFKSEGEVLDVLELMEEAHSRKRKASEIS